MVPGFVLAERYRVESLLGEGNAGKVYVGEQVFLRKKVAIKVISAERADIDELVQRFQREALVTAGSDNPNIASAIEVGTLADGAGFFVAEYTPGRSLRQEILAGRLPVPRALHIVRQLASALADAHELGVVHHDVKPENLMLIRRGDDADFVKLLDFGLARVSVAVEKDAAGKAPLVLGTPEYRAPEQARGLPCDKRADLYSLGVVLFEMVSGARPFEGASVLRTKSAAHTPTLSERTAGGRVPAELEALIGKLLAVDPQDRPHGAEDVLEAVDKLLAGLAGAAPAARPVSDSAPALKPSVPPARSVPPTARASTPPAIQRPKSGAPPAPAAAAGKEQVAVDDDSNVPTQLHLPKVTPSAPPPAVAEKPKHSLAATVITRRAPEPSARYVDSVRTKASAAFAKAPPWLRQAGARARAGVRGRERAVLGGAVALGAVALLLTFVFTGGTSSEAAATPPNELRVGLNAASPGATAAEAPAPTAQPKQTAAPAAAPLTDEAAVFLRVAKNLADEKRDAEAVALVSRTLLRQPELKSDARVGDVLARAARSETTAVAEESFAQLSTVMGELGATLIYALALDPNARESAKKRAESWLSSKDFDRVSSAALYTTVKLRAAKSCEQKRALLGLAGDVGEQQTLDYLRELEGRVVCRPNDLANCLPCLSQDGKLTETISRVEKRLKK